MQSGRLVSGIAVALILACAAGVAAASDEAVRRDTGGQEVREFPVWRLLPTNHYATLSDQLIDGRRWALYLFEGSSSRQACLQAFLLKRSRTGVSVLTGRPECSVLTPHKGFGASQMSITDGTALGVVTAISETARVEVELVPGGVSRYRTRVLNQRQRSKSGLPPLRYAAFVATGDCLENLKGQDGKGQTTFDTGPRGCK